MMSCLSNSSNVKKAKIYKQDDSFTLVSLEYPPYAYHDENGNVTGSDVEILRQAAKNIGIDIMFTLLNWEEALRLTRTGSADGIFIAYKKESREIFFDFVIPHLSIDELALFKNSNFSKKIKKISDLNSQKIGIVKGFSYPDEFENFTDCIKVKAESLDKLVEMLIKGDIDIAIASKKPTNYLLNKKKKNATKEMLNNISKISTLSLILSVEPNYLAFSKRSKKSKGVITRFKNALLELDNSGKMFEIRKRFE